MSPSTLHFCQVGTSWAVSFCTPVLTGPPAHQPGVGGLKLSSDSLLGFAFWSPAQRVESLSAPVPKPGSLLLFSRLLRGLSFLYHTPHYMEDVCSGLSWDSTGILQLRKYYMNPSIPGAQHRVRGYICTQGPYAATSTHIWPRDVPTYKYTCGCPCLHRTHKAALSAAPHFSWLTKSACSNRAQRSYIHSSNA